MANSTSRSSKSEERSRSARRARSMELQRIGEGRNGKFSFQFVLDNGEEKYILRPAAEHARTLMRMIDEAESMYSAQGIGPSSSRPSLDVMGRKRSLVYLFTYE